MRCASLAFRTLSLLDSSRNKLHLSSVVIVTENEVFDPFSFMPFFLFVLLGGGGGGVVKRFLM